MSATTTELTRAPVLDELQLVDFAVGDDPAAQARLALPISAESGSPHSVVYLEVDPGRRIPLHTHNAEEVFVVLQGTGVVTAGDEQWAASPGAIAVAPAFVRHGWENTGSETLKLVAFLGANVLITEFDEPVAPFGTARFVVPAGA
ncbi:MAG TPA: cupin domain-containing protein [Gaiellaceae bacterium]|nr:cupin domain-containing protein [Gaiellaceae bacterium]